MMTAVRQTATVSLDGRIDVAVPELAPGTTAEVVVLVPEPTPAATIAERLAAPDLDPRRAVSGLTDEQVRQWLEDIRLERSAWRTLGDVEP